jgi:extracellular elastinolytic metalloproteinase
LKKRDQVDPIAALKGADKRLNLGVNAEKAEAVPEPTVERYIIKGSTGALSDPLARLVYFQNPDHTLTLTWRVETDIRDNWLLTYVDAKKPETVFGVVDYVSDATYQV